MPPMFAGRKNANQEIEQIWTYLKEAEQQKLPDGLLRNDSYELFPAKEERPIVFRTFIHGVGSHAVAVGYPQGVHAAFDAYASRWALIWKGRYLDAATTWTDRYSAPDKPLGTAVKNLGGKAVIDGAAKFGGFVLDKKGVPTFRYTIKKWRFEDRLVPRGNGFVRQLVIAGPDGALKCRSLMSGTKTVTIKSGQGLLEENVQW